MPARPAADYGPFARFKREILAADEAIRQGIREAAQTLPLDAIEPAVMELLQTAKETYRRLFQEFER